MEAFEAHYDEVLNQAAREEEERGEETQLQARQQKRRQVVEKVRAHMARLDSGAVEKAMAGMDMTAILTEKNIEAAIKELKKTLATGRGDMQTQSTSCVFVALLYMGGQFRPSPAVSLAALKPLPVCPHDAGGAMLEGLASRV